MSFLRNVWTDLRDKRLWPVAVALVLALIAVPVLLRGGSDTPASDVAAIPATPAASAGTAATRAAAVNVADDVATGKVDRSGAVHDPFVQHHKPHTDTTPDPSAATPTTPTSATPSTGTASSSGDAAPAATTTSPATTTTSTTPATTTDGTTTPAADPTVYGVDLRFGVAGQGKLYSDVTRLTPLPDADNPLFVFMGLTDDGASAVFMVSNDAVPSGDGTCLPSADDCESVQLAPGDTEFFDVQDGTAGLVEYQLDVKKISKKKASSTATATRFHKRESSAGREYLRTVIAADPTTMSGWQWSAKLGLLVPKTPVATTKVPAPAATTVPAAAAGK